MKTTLDRQATLGRMGYVLGDYSNGGHSTDARRRDPNSGRGLLRRQQSDIVSSSSTVMLQPPMLTRAQSKRAVLLRMAEAAENDVVGMGDGRSLTKQPSKRDVFLNAANVARQPPRRGLQRNVSSSAACLLSSRPLSKRNLFAEAKAAVSSSTHPNKSGASSASNTTTTLARTSLMRNVSWRTSFGKAVRRDSTTSRASSLFSSSQHSTVTDETSSPLPPLRRFTRSQSKCRVGEGGSSSPSHGARACHHVNDATPSAHETVLVQQSWQEIRQAHGRQPTEWIMFGEILLLQMVRLQSETLHQLGIFTFSQSGSRVAALTNLLVQTLDAIIGQAGPNFSPSDEDGSQEWSSEWRFQFRSHGLDPAVVAAALPATLMQWASFHCRHSKTQPETICGNLSLLLSSPETQRAWQSIVIATLKNWNNNNYTTQEDNAESGMKYDPCL